MATKLSFSTILGLNSLKIDSHEMSIDIQLDPEQAVAHALDVMRQQTLGALLDKGVIDQRIFENLSLHKLG